MARNFDGTDDNLSSPADSVPGVEAAAESFGIWVTRAGDPGANQTVMVLAQALSAGNAKSVIACAPPATSGWKILFQRIFATTGTWTATNDMSNARHHIAVVYDGGSTSNNPTFYVDAVSVAVTTTTAPTGARGTGADNVRLGESVAGTTDLAATLQHFAMDASVLWTAAEVNRAMWWGRPRGGLVLYHPFVTTKLADEGSGAETLIAQGTTVVEFPTPCVRPGSAMMGMGMGW